MVFTLTQLRDADESMMRVVNWYCCSRMWDISLDELYLYSGIVKRV